MNPEEKYQVTSLFWAFQNYGLLMCSDESMYTEKWIQVFEINDLRKLAVKNIIAYLSVQFSIYSVTFCVVSDYKNPWTSHSTQHLWYRLEHHHWRNCWSFLNGRKFEHPYSKITDCFLKIVTSVSHNIQEFVSCTSCLETSLGICFWWFSDWIQILVSLPIVRSSHIQ